MVGVRPLSAHEGFVDFYGTLGTPELVAVHGAATLLVATLVVGLLPLYGTEAVNRARRWSVSSTLLGVPFAAGLVAALWLGLILTESGLWFVIGVPMVIVALVFLPSWAALGFVAAGQSIAVRFGVERLPVDILIAGLIGALVPIQPVVGGAILAVLTCLGVGTGARTLFQYMFTGLGEERPTPPSSKI